MSYVSIDFATLQHWKRSVCASFQAELLDQYAAIFAVESDSSALASIAHCSLARYEALIASQGALAGSFLLLFAIRRLHEKQLGLEHDFVVESVQHWYATEQRVGHEGHQHTTEHLLREDYAPQSSFWKL